MGFMQGKRVLIVGLASNRSIAWGIAQAMHHCPTPPNCQNQVYVHPSGYPLRPITQTLRVPLTVEVRPADHYRYLPHAPWQPWGV